MVKMLKDLKLELNGQKVQEKNLLDTREMIETEKKNRIILFYMKKRLQNCCRKFKL
jgi:hypothetical protein